MTREELIAIFKETGVMLEGHFQLTSGRHSDHYMQCAQLFQYPKYSKLLCGELAKAFSDEKIDLVAGPAVGGIIIAYQTAECLGVRNIFAERQEGKMTFRRGFAVKPGENVLVCEDVVTTGGSVREVIDLVREAGGNVVGVGSIVDRSNGKVDFGVPFKAVLSMEVVSWEAQDCPLCKSGSVAVKPGSRLLK
ncbi:MAG: orotate phosphoribosyltransferase [Christensenellales bacterium]|jgi:orotate phosphoribosyltransferase